MRVIAGVAIGTFAAVWLAAMGIAWSLIQRDVRRARALRELAQAERDAAAALLREADRARRRWVTELVEGRGRN